MTKLGEAVEKKGPDNKAKRGKGLSSVFGSRPTAWEEAPASDLAGQQAAEPARLEPAAPAVSPASNPVRQQASKPATLQTRASMEADGANKVKATYYIEPALIKSLKFLAIEQDTDLSALVNTAIRDLIAKKP